jgi:hypothetical protein
MDITTSLLPITTRPGTPAFDRWVGAVAHRIDEQGIGAVAAEIDVLAALARQRGLVPVSVRALTDPTGPEPARCRAFGRVIGALITPTTATAAAAAPVSRRTAA